jgi:hypothetical protein
MSSAVLPNWIVAGAPKSSTSSVFRWLMDHPQVDGPAEKETCYFVDPGAHLFRKDGNFRDQGIAGYARLFAHCDPAATVIVESTPAYLYSRTALRELPKLPTRPSFIFVLREPISQLRSLFTYFQQNWNWIPRSMTFQEFIEAVEEGRSDFGGNELASNALQNAWYSDHLLRWRDAVGEDRMLILLFEDLVGDSRGAMQDLAVRLGIDPSFYDDYGLVAENETYEVRNAMLQDLNIFIRGYLPKGRFYEALRSLYRAANTRRPSRVQSEPAIEERLAEYYAPMHRELEQEFGLNLARWRSASGGAAAAHAPESGSALPPVYSAPRMFGSRR